MTLNNYCTSTKGFVLALLTDIKQIFILIEFTVTAHVDEI